MTSALKWPLLEEQATNNGFVFAVCCLHEQLVFTLEQQLKELQSIDLKQFPNQLKYYELDDLDDNFLESLEFSHFYYFPKYVHEYIAIALKKHNEITSKITGLTAIKELRKLYASALEFPPVSEDLLNWSQPELVNLCEQLQVLIKIIVKDYSVVSICTNMAAARLEARPDGDFSLLCSQRAELLADKWVGL